MLTDYEWQYETLDHKLIRMFGVLFFTFLLLAICILSVLLLNLSKKPLPPVQQAIPAVLPLTGPPAVHYFTYLPVAQSAPVSGPANIWKVTRIDTLGYELQGQHYDLATFTRLDGQVTLQGYCINRGWDIPVIGTEYWLDGDTFTPLHEPAGDPFQRFLKIN